MNPTKIDLSANIRQSIAVELNERLADTVDLAMQAKQAHWNVKGPQFAALHTLFDDVATNALEYADLLAERVTALGGTARGTVRMAAEQSQLTEYPLTITEGNAHIDALSDAVARLARSTRAAIKLADDKGDAGSADLFTEISRGLDKQLWLLEAHLQTMH